MAEKNDAKQDAVEMMNHLKELILKPDVRSERLKIVESLTTAWVMLYEAVSRK